MGSVRSAEYRVRSIVSMLLLAGGLFGTVFLTIATMTGQRTGGGATDLLVGFVAVAVGFILVVRVPENRIGLVIGLLVFAGTGTDVIGGLRDWAREENFQALAVAASQLSDVSWLLFFVSSFVLLPVWFPTGVAISKGWEWVPRLAAVGVALVYVGIALSEFTCVQWAVEQGDQCVEFFSNPWGVSGLEETMFESLFIPPMLLAIPAVVSIFIRFRRAADVERLQLRWFAFGVSSLVVTFVLFLLVPVDLGNLENNVMNLLLIGVFLSIALAILRYRLYEIDRVISRTVSYGLVVGLLGLFFAVGAVWLPTTLEVENQLFVAATTLAVAALFNPVRRRMQSWVDHRFNRSRFVAEQVMEEFAGSLQGQVDPDGVVDGWVGVVEETMQPETVGVWVRR